MARHAHPPGGARFYERVNALRVARGWNHVELARHSGVDRSVWLRIKTLRGSPQPETVIKLADAVGMDREEAFQIAGLLDTASEADTLPAGTPELADPEVEALLARLKPEERAVLELVREQEYARLRAEAAEARKRWRDLVRRTHDEGRTGEE